MEGYDETTYGERFADVYDDWYGSITDTEACVEAVARLADGGPVLELGVGTGRLAIPLAQRGIQVTGVDASPAMLAALSDKPGGDAVEAVLGDMTDPPVGDRRFAVVFVAYNTLFNLVTVDGQRTCLANAARRLQPGGCVAIEAFVPDVSDAATDSVVPKRVSADQVVLSVSQQDPVRQEIIGQYIDISETGIRLRPWHIRWSTPEQLDVLAAEAGLHLSQRWASWSGDDFDDTSTSHISVYRIAD
ncbi:MAG: class I SAM-dependent methyltransferase [Aquihabitans sp.]